MSEARIDSISNESNTGGPTISGITTFSGENYLVLPVGTTAERPLDCPPGSLRFNSDNGHLEYFRGDSLGWEEIEASNVELGSLSVNSGGTTVPGGLGHRGVFAGGQTPTAVNYIAYVTIPTTGNSLDFGNLITASKGRNGCASSVLGLFGGGHTASATFTTEIDYITFSSTGNAQDFGDMTLARGWSSALSSNTRGIMAGGETPTGQDRIDYMHLTTTGSAVDFGNLTVGRSVLGSAWNKTRGVWSGGNNGGPVVYNIIDYVTIASGGNARDFGDITSGASQTAITHAEACCSSTRGVWSSIREVPAYVNRIDYITVATLGNTQDFGDQTSNRGGAGSAASSTRGVWAGGYGQPAFRNIIDYVTIATTGDAKDFGDLVVDGSVNGTVDYVAGCSNGHGGL